MNINRFHSHQDPSIQLPSSGNMNNQQSLEAVDEEILQLERVLVRECINKKCRGKSTAGTSMSISGGEMAFDLHSKYLMCARDSCHPLRKKKRSTVQLSVAFAPFMDVLRTFSFSLRGVNCKGLRRWKSLLSYQCCSKSGMAYLGQRELTKNLKAQLTPGAIKIWQ